MRKINFLLTLLVLFVAAPFARAEKTTITPYSESFEGLTPLTDHAFAPEYWSHIVDEYVDDYDEWSSGETYYVSYYSRETGGVNNGTYIEAGSQTIGSGYSKTANDLLVTPALSGDVTMYLKLTKTSGTVTFFTCTRNLDGSFTKGDAYTVTDMPTLSTEEWTQVTIPAVAEGTYLGIRLNYACIDEFTAASISYGGTKSLKVTKITKLNTNSYIDLTPEGTATFSFEVTVQNTGDENLNPGDEGYSLSIKDNSADTLIGEPTAIDQALAPGETYTLTVTATCTFDITDKIYHNFHIVENIGGASSNAAWYDIYPYLPNFQVSIVDKADVLADGTVVDFGMIGADSSKSYRLRNNTGGAPATITSITAPEGFSFKVTAKNDDTVEYTEFPITIPAHSELKLTVTASAAAAGTWSGNVAIDVDTYKTFNLAVVSIVTDPTKWFVNFEDEKYPVGSYTTNASSWSMGDYKVGGNKYVAKNGSSSDPTLFVSPKLSVAPGETLSFQASQNSYSTYADNFVNIYYSTDRKNWTLLRTISNKATDEADKILVEKESEYPYPAKLKTFILEGVPAGEGYIAFESGYACIDNIYGFSPCEVPTLDIVATEVKLPTEMTVNYTYKPAITFINAGSSDIAEGALKVRYVVGGETVAEQDVPAIARDSYNRTSPKSLTLEWTPRTAGTFPAKIEIYGEGFSYAEESTVVVSEESAIGWLNVGDYTTESSSSLITSNFCNNETETIYTADQIRLEAGAQIEKIMYRGYKATANQLTNLQYYIENTTDEAPVSTGMTPYDHSGMTEVYNGEYTFVKNGTSSEHVDLIQFDLATPFVYTGGNIRVVIISKSEKFANFYVESFNKAGVNVTRRNDKNTETNNLTTVSFSKVSSVPVLYLWTERQIPTISGTVTNKATGAAIEGAEVTLTSGNTIYSATTDANGAYSADIYQDNLDYSISVAKDGYYAFPYDESENITVSAKAGSVVQDIQLTEAKGLRIIDNNVPTTATVNHAYTATAKVLNGANRQWRNGYTAVLHVGDDITVEAPANMIQANAEAEFEFTFTPHATGTFDTYIEFVAEGITAATDVVQLTIGAETADAEVQVGTVSSKTSFGPVNLFYKKSVVELVYPKSMLGIPAGTKIDALRFKGYHAAKNLTYNVKSWVANVPEGTANTGRGVEGMTLYKDDQLSLAVAKGSKDNTETIYEISFPDGFIYDGGDIRIVSTSSADGFQSVNFEVTDVTGHMLYGADDNINVDDLSCTKNDRPLPVMYLAVTPSKNVSGTVTIGETGAAVANTPVVVKSGEIEYYGTTDENGAYSVDVIQHTLDYTVNVSVAGYLPSAEPISFADGDVVANIVLNKGFVKGQVLDADTNEPIAGAYVDISDSNWAIIGSLEATGEDGAFNFEVSAAGDYYLSAEAPYYFFERQDPDPATVTTTGVVSNIYLKSKSFAVTGVVYDKATNQPVLDAKVDLYCDGEVVATSPTGSETGDYFFEDIDHVGTKTYFVRAYRDGYKSEDITLDFSTVGAWNSLLESQDIYIGVGDSGVSTLTANGFKAFGGKGNITVVSAAGVVNIYNEVGSLIRSEKVQNGKTTFNGLNAGIYIVNGVKVAVK
ncbi:MAG: carboxypeptidase regulatory-like domain-containing protein [Bacteroidales bacterium]|nr:carboxypeptidase regulatory-like domain-containing protein [Bacteroidales bacterium]